MTEIIDPFSSRDCAAFLDGRGRLPNNPVVATLIAALFSGGPRARMLLGGWVERENGSLTYTHFGRRGGEITVRLEARERAGGKRSSPWEVVEAFNALTVDVVLTVLAELCDPRLGSKVLSPRRNALGVSTSAVLAYKGYRRWGRERAEFVSRICAEVVRLSLLRIDIRAFPGWDGERGGWSPEGVSICDDQIFSIALPNEDMSKDGVSETGTVSDRVWPMRLGRWSEIWLNAQGKVWTTDMPLGLIGLDHRPNRPAHILAKKVGLNTLFLMGMLKTRPVLVRRLDHLLESIGELPSFEARDGHWAGRIRDRFEEAALILLEDGIIGSLRWPDAATPGASNRQKGWVEHWLAAKIEIARPAPTAAAQPPPPAGHGFKVGRVKAATDRGAIHFVPETAARNGLRGVNGIRAVSH